jgi:hypothetical protein
MFAPPNSLILFSPDTDFLSVAAMHIQQELGLACVALSSKDNIKQHVEGALAVVSTEPLDKNPGIAVLQVPVPPLKLQDLLDDIGNLLHNHGACELRLGSQYSLLLRQKQLLHPKSQNAVLLTDKEVQLLQQLAAGAGESVPREQLLKEVWGFGDSLDTHTLETHIYRLRGKFRELSGDDAAIAATEGGYALKNV